ncbi:hypothetical protein DFP73DRAFT_599651 [Morchella snyderi]|nr:hypothetical protein DFP73DRAFT_599651 [Morchella snyderi]
MANRDPFLRRGKFTQAEGPEGEGSQDDGQEVTTDQEISPDCDLGRPRGRGDTDGIGEDVITNDFEDLLTRNELLCVPDPHLVPKSIKATSLDRALAYLDSTSANSGPTGNYALQRFIQSPTIPSAHLADPFSLNTASTDEEMDRPSDSSFSELPEIIQSYSQPTYGINGQIIHPGNFNYLAKHNPVSPSLPSRSQLQLGNLQQQQLEASSMGRATQSLPGCLELELVGSGYGSKSERESVTTGIGSSLDRLRALRQRSTNPSTNRSVSKESREREEDELLNDDLELLDFDLPITTSPKEVEWPIEDIINYNTSWLVDNVSGTSSARVNMTPMQNRQFTPERSLLLDYPQNIIAPEGTAQNSGQEISSMSFSSSFLVEPPDSYSASRPRELSQFTPPPPSGMVYSLEELPRAPHINQYGLFPPPGVLHSRGIPTPISQSTFGVQHPYGVQTPAPQSSGATTAPITTTATTTTRTITWVNGVYSWVITTIACALLD